MMGKFLKLFAAFIVVFVCGTCHSYAAYNMAQNIPGWKESYIQNSGVELGVGKNVMRITTEPELVYEGKGSLHLFMDSQPDGVNFQAVQTVNELENGKTYIVSGYFYVPGNSARYRLRFGSTHLVNMSEVVGGIHNQWTYGEYIFEFTGFSSKNFSIQHWGTGDTFADNVSLREVIYAEDGLTIASYGEELLENGDFEEGIDLVSPKEISGISVNNMDKKAEITWTNPDDEDLSFVRIYDVTDGKNELLAEGNENSYAMSDLKNGKAYTLLICTVDIPGNCSEGVYIEVNPVADPSKFSAPVFYINNEVAENIGSGVLKAEMQFKNNSMPEDYSAEIILILMKDGALVDIANSYSTIIPSHEDEPYTKLEAEINVPEGSGYTAALYVWDSLSGMEAISEYFVLN